MREHDIALSKFWRIRCMTLDILDYFEDGDISYLKNILEVDIPQLKKAIEEEIADKEKKSL